MECKLEIGFDIAIVMLAAVRQQLVAPEEKDMMANG